MADLENCLTKNQFRKIGKQIMDDYYKDKKKMSFQDLREGYLRTGASEEIINRNISQYKEKLRKEKEKSEKTKKNLKWLGRGVVKGITYPTLGCLFAMPTMTRKAYDFISKTYSDISAAIPVIYGMSCITAYACSLEHINRTSKDPFLFSLIGVAFGIQCLSNAISGTYELVRNKQKRDLMQISSR